MSDRPRVTVLGASGYIGSAVTAALARHPVRLRAVGRRPLTLAGPGFDVPVLAVDVRSAEGLVEAVQDADVVVHLVAHTDGVGGWRAAEHDAGTVDLNTALMARLVDALEAVRRPDPPVVLFAGTCSTGPAGPRSQDDATSQYERQKRLAEDVLVAATARGDVRGITLRLPTVFGAAPSGPGRGFITTMVGRALDGRPLTMWHDGAVRRDLLHVADASAAFVAAQRHAARLCGRSWDVGSGAGTGVRAQLEHIADSVARRTGRPPVPVVTVRPPAHATDADFRDVTVDAAPFRGATGWAPTVPFRPGLDGVVASLASAGGRVDPLVRPRSTVGAPEDRSREVVSS